MRIPYTKLTPATLRSVVQEFVTRDGTDHSSVERRVERVLRQLEAGRVEVHFDDETATCNIVNVESGAAPPADGAGAC
ncbi:MAG: YheU family protein [Planctomycetes bacterium]|nr:YheU family protein [Planctomycetota bacterium]